MPRPALLLAIAVLSAASYPCGAIAGAAPKPPHHVVSYVVSAADSSAEVPEEPGIPFMLPTHRWQWRVYDAASRRDYPFLELPSFPVGIRWDSSFTSVDFVVGDRIMRAPWKLGASMQELARLLPVDSSMCDLWSDPAGRWHLVTQRNVPTVLADGTQSTVPVATRWDWQPSGTWRPAAVDSPGGGHYGECYTSPNLQGNIQRLRAVPIGSLLDSMRIGNYRDSTIEEDSGGTDFSGRVWIRSNLDPSIGLEMGAGFGDTYHAHEPIIWVDRRRGKRKTVYAKGQSQNDAFGQLAFAERNGFLLVVAEYSGAYPAVVDMRSGKVLFRMNRPSARAVWVPAPR